jgi:hypothetical protein
VPAFDHGYAVTSISQGLIADRVLVNIETGVYLWLLNSAWHVAISRAQASIRRSGSPSVFERHHSVRTATTFATAAEASCFA